jgi:hypothetical protein
MEAAWGVAGVVVGAFVTQALNLLPVLFGAPLRAIHSAY